MFQNYVYFLVYPLSKFSLGVSWFYCLWQRVRFTTDVYVNLLNQNAYVVNLMRQHLVSFMKKNPQTVNIAILPWCIRSVWKLVRKYYNLFLWCIVLFFDGWQKQNMILWKCNNTYWRKIRFIAHCVMQHLMKLYFRSFLMLNDCFKKRKKRKKDMRNKAVGCFHLKILL